MTYKGDDHHLHGMPEIIYADPGPALKAAVLAFDDGEVRIVEVIAMGSEADAAETAIYGFRGLFRKLKGRYRPGRVDRPFPDRGKRCSLGRGFRARYHGRRRSQQADRPSHRDAANAVPGKAS